jgi:hypothetical protein
MALKPVRTVRKQLPEQTFSIWAKSRFGAQVQYDLDKVRRVLKRVLAANDWLELATLQAASAALEDPDAPSFEVRGVVVAKLADEEEVIWSKLLELADELEGEFRVDCRITFRGWTLI